MSAKFFNIDVIYFKKIIINYKSKKKRLIYFLKRISKYLVARILDKMNETVECVSLKHFVYNCTFYAIIYRDMHLYTVCEIMYTDLHFEILQHDYVIYCRYCRHLFTKQTIYDPDI